MKKKNFRKNLTGTTIHRLDPSKQKKTEDSVKAVSRGERQCQTKSVNNAAISSANRHKRRNKKGEDTYPYTRCHLIGCQLTGQNNNPKNLTAGTRRLNTMGMPDYVNRVANTLQSDPKCYIRYRVKQVSHGNELTARGVQMEAQSVGSNAASCNVFVFNARQGYQINYSNGTSEAKKWTSSRQKTKSSEAHL